MLAFERTICDAITPSSTAGRMVLNSSSTKMTSAASFATSVPLFPIEIPMSAIFSAGASLTGEEGIRQSSESVIQTSYSPPSPVIATTAPRLWKASTIAILCFGVVLANTLTPPTLSFN